jgi:uncharacterized protein YcfJ
MTATPEFDDIMLMEIDMPRKRPAARKLPETRKLPASDEGQVWRIVTAVGAVLALGVGIATYATGGNDGAAMVWTLAGALAGFMAIVIPRD